MPAGVALEFPPASHSERAEDRGAAIINAHEVRSHWEQSCGQVVGVVHLSSEVLSWLVVK